MFRQKFLFFIRTFVLQMVAGTVVDSYSNFAVVNITKTSFANITAQNKSNFVLFYSDRCDDCDELRQTWQQLSQNLRDDGFEDVVVSQVDCCIETELCDTSDRRTKCVGDKKLQENEIWTITDGTKACIKETEKDNDPVLFPTIDECSNKCKQLTTMFAYGTNEFGGQGCKEGLCKCHCIKDDNDAACNQDKSKDYWFFKFNDEDSTRNSRIHRNSYWRQSIH